MLLNPEPDPNPEPEQHPEPESNSEPTPPEPTPVVKDDMQLTLDDLLAYLHTKPEHRLSGHDEPPPESNTSVHSSGNLRDDGTDDVPMPSEDDPVNPTHGPPSHHDNLPPGVPHIPGFMVAQMQVHHGDMSAPDYINATHHMFNYIGILNNITEDSYEVFGSIYEVPETDSDIVSGVCLVNCEGNPITDEEFYTWAARYLEGGRGNEHEQA